LKWKVAVAGNRERKDERNRYELEQKIRYRFSGGMLCIITLSVALYPPPSDPQDDLAAWNSLTLLGGGRDHQLSVFQSNQHGRDYNAAYRGASSAACHSNRSWKRRRVIRRR